jgi:AcrR family transcriptional regulator
MVPTDDDSSETTQLLRPARRRNPEESRRRILDAGERAFALRGFGGARLRDIAQEAGVHHALVHHYFDDKHGLFQEVLNRGIERISLAGRDALAAPTGLEAAVRAFVGVLFDFCSNNRFLLRIIEDALRNREWASWQVTHDALAALAGPLLSLLKQRIEIGQRHGTVRSEITPESLIMLGFGAIVYGFDTAETLLSAMGLPQPTEQDLAVQREHAIQYVVGAMRPSGS